MQEWNSNSRPTPILFATSNRGKLDEAKQVLGPLGFSVQSHGGKGIEIQADTTSEVAAYSVRQAAKKARQPILVEDAGLFVDALGGFPGVYSAYVLKTLGVDGIIVLLEKSRSRSAKFVSSVAYCEPQGEPSVFDGSVSGIISDGPRGNGGFGFDPIFVPDGQKLTFGEFTLEDKCAVSHRGDALRKFARWWHASHRLR
jgi:XTP/dITP diphosphohydrolase